MAKNLVLWAIIAAVLMTVFNNFQNVSQTKELKYSEFISSVRSGQVERVSIAGQNIEGVLSDGESFTSILPAYDDKLIDDLLNNSVQVEGKKPEQQSIWTQLLVASFPILVIIAVFMFFNEVADAECLEGGHIGHVDEARVVPDHRNMGNGDTGGGMQVPDHVIVHRLQNNVQRCGCIGQDNVHNLCVPVDARFKRALWFMPRYITANVSSNDVAQHLVREDLHWTFCNAEIEPDVGDVLVRLRAAQGACGVGFVRQDCARCGVVGRGGIPGHNL